MALTDVLRSLILRFMGMADHEGRWACTACGGTYALEGSRPVHGSTSVILKCTSCGHEESATLLAAAVPSAPRSGAALLEDTPPAAARRRLALVSEPILPPAKAHLAPIAPAPEPAPEPAAPSAEEPAAAQPKPLALEPVEPLEVEVTPSGRIIEEIPSQELLDAPPSVREPPDDGSLADAVAPDDGDDAEPVSLKEVVVVPRTPLPPRAGTLGTLPPTARPSAPPPPSIEVVPPSSRQPSVARRRAASAVAAGKDEACDETRGGPWTSVASVAGLVVVVWLGARALGGSEDATSPQIPDPPPMTGATSLPTSSPPSGGPTASASALKVVDVPETALISSRDETSRPTANVVAATAAPAAEHPPTSAVEPPRATAPPRPSSEGATEGPSTSTSGLSIAGILDRAAAARRSGDLARARALYTQALEAHRGDVEANAGLGEIARATGDLPSARRHFQEALASSPSFYPALLGLADTQWDLGDHVEAQHTYARILSQRDTTPERVRDRGAPRATPAVPTATAVAPPPDAPEREDDAP